MTIRKTLVGLLFLTVVGLFSTAQQVEIKKVPIRDVSPSSGQDMYVNYCAACHGRDGRGSGPAAPALKTSPTNLTKLTKAGGGTFPAMHVYNTISGDVTLAAHGDKDMPVWGNAFRSLHPGPAQTVDVHQRIGNITDYIHSLQEK